ncbi:hypothetical protein VCRA2122O339_30121 [Vibrio crassostreae]|nr:hypothetical protein VCRA2120E331_40122 [Vibrio crassostreae]CAK3524390.1 hypothetical protein VCRA2122O339_30121 [Vibrio crassostreae]CAK3540406.1 hypothetical protein VCRA2127O345_40096 [Vibrio crassostreae]CAK3551431.1 hypothetical protein VCRA2120E330_40123 [Vibrio crassostreae]CAK3577292.1 hypothetical protein VCRA2122O338_40096 [Vibrio crassostreae]
MTPLSEILSSFLNFIYDSFISIFHIITLLILSILIKVIFINVG